jgi:hypothetical protein
MALFIEVAFRLVGLDWREYVIGDKGLCRPTDIVRLMIEARQDR